jgi:hypothetical protein
MVTMYILMRDQLHVVISDKVSDMVTMYILMRDQLYVVISYKVSPAR